MTTKYIVGKTLPPLYVGQDCCARIDAALARLGASRPSSPVSRTDLLRQWIWDGLRALDPATPPVSFVEVPAPPVPALPAAWVDHLDLLCEVTPDAVRALLARGAPGR